MKKIILMMVLIVLLFPLSISANTTKIIDDAGLFTDRQLNNINKKLAEFEANYDYDLIIYTSRDNFNGPAELWAADYYDEHGYGDGIILAINMLQRQYAIVSTGRAQKSFNNREIDYMLDSFIYDMRVGNYYNVVSDFITKSANIIQEHSFFLGLTSNQTIAIASSSVTVGGLVSIIYVIYLKQKMNMKRVSKKATHYYKPSSLKLSQKNDVFLYSRTHRVAIPKSTSRSSSSGSSHSFSSSSGRSHSGGSRRF